MKRTIFAILTNKEMRGSRMVQKALDQEFTVGVPWFDKSRVEITSLKIDVA